MIPRQVRSRIRRWRLLRPVRVWVIARTSGLYDSDYYADVVGPTSADSAPTIAASIVRDLQPRTLLDIGCGTGAIMAALRTLGIMVTGLESSEAALAYCRRSGLDVRRFDIARDHLAAPKEAYDVVFSSEVAEHLPEELADKFVEILVSQSDTVILTAATPGQGGLGHINEQPHSYWIEKLQAREFALVEGLTRSWRREWSHAPLVAPWYAANVMIFSRNSGRPSDGSLH